MFVFFFFKQKTAYEMRISDWSSDVCSSDLLNHAIKRDPRTGLRSADSNWDFWTLLPEALHQVTIVMSDRGIPKTLRHMHGFGSHTFSMINAANERVWVKDRKSTRLNSSH